MTSRPDTAAPSMVSFPSGLTANLNVPEIGTKLLDTWRCDHETILLSFLFVGELSRAENQTQRLES